jgi:hypothetical protein
VIDDHHAMIQLKGNDLLVRSQIPLSKGMEGYFRVEATSPQVILKFIPEGEMPGEERVEQQIDLLLKRYLPFDFSKEDLFEQLSKLWGMKGEMIPLGMQSTMDRLRSLLQGFSIGEPFSLDPEHLREIVTQGGLFFERKLRDLIETQTEDQYDQIVRGDMKGLLMELRSQLKSLMSLGIHQEEASLPLKEIMGNLDQLLRKIEGYQILNLNASNHPGKVFLLIPLWFQNNLQLVEMNLSLPRPDGDRSSSGEHAIFFLLHLPDWGRVSIEANMKGKGLYCRFTVSDPEVSTFLNDAFPELRARLNRIGFQPHLAVSIESPEKMVQTWLGELEERREAWLNIVV